MILAVQYPNFLGQIDDLTALAGPCTRAARCCA